MIGTRFSGLAVRKPKIPLSWPPRASLRGLPATTAAANQPGLRVSEPTISGNGLLCQLEVGFQAGLDVASIWG